MMNCIFHFFLKIKTAIVGHKALHLAVSNSNGLRTTVFQFFHVVLTYQCSHILRIFKSRYFICYYLLILRCVSCIYRNYIGLTFVVKFRDGLTRFQIQDFFHLGSRISDPGSYVLCKKGSSKNKHTFSLLLTVSGVYPSFKCSSVS
jgi:hypothetical protein